MIYREKQYNDTLCHFNPNHDPRNGQFAKSATGNIIVVQNTKEKKEERQAAKIGSGIK